MAKIYYYDIGDYLSREQKLEIVQTLGSVGNPSINWQMLQPNEHGDWLAQRDDHFGTFTPLAPDKKFDTKTQSIFNTYAIGVATNRDAWVYNFSETQIENNMKAMIAFYNAQKTLFKLRKSEDEKADFDSLVSVNPTKISWTRALKKDAEKGVKHAFEKEGNIREGCYRPFCKQKLYFHKPFIESPGLSSMLFPTSSHENILICVTGIGASKSYSVLASNHISNLDTLEKSQCFPLYYYEPVKQEKNLFNEGQEGDVHELVKRDAISDFILGRARIAYGKLVTKEDIFYYVYGLLHSPAYRERYAADLKKMLPRLPLIDDTSEFWAFSRAGRKLADLHINYEAVRPAEGVTIKGAESGHYEVEKMRFPSKADKSRIQYNSRIMVENIPAKAYEYVVNGKSAIEWVMERYQVTTHKESGIRNDPNDWSAEQGNPGYILDLLLSVIRVSVETVDIVKGLPELRF